MTSPDGIVVEIPGRKTLRIAHLLLDFTGTLAEGGHLIPGVAERLRRLSDRLDVEVLTADTFGTARDELKRLPLQVQLVCGADDKARRVNELGPDSVCAVGNGVNDLAMVALAALGIAVVGPEGAAGPLVARADIVVRDIAGALDLLLDPRRLRATLRS